MLGLDNSQIQKQLTALSEQPEKLSNDVHIIITAGNTLESKEGEENA
jgi:hypothetical protein